MKIGMKLGIAFSSVTLILYMGINATSSLNQSVQVLAKDKFPKTVWANNII